MSRTLLCLTTVAALLARPAAAALYVHETRQELMSLRLTSMAAPVIGQNMSGEFMALSLAPEKQDGYSVVRSRCAAARAGREITVELLFTTLYGAGRLGGTTSARGITLTALAGDGTSHQLVFRTMSEGQWNARVTHFRSICRLGRLAYEDSWWHNEANKTAERLKHLEALQPNYVAAEEDAAQYLLRAQSDHQSALRREKAAKEVAQDARKLSQACEQCTDMELVQSALELNRAAEGTVRDVQAGIVDREPEKTALERLATMRQQLQEKTRAVEAARGQPGADVGTAACGVGTAACGVGTAACGVGSAVIGREAAVQEAQRIADEAAGELVRLQSGISEAKARIAQAKREIAAIDAQGMALARRLGLWPKHQAGRRARSAR